MKVGGAWRAEAQVSDGRPPLTFDGFAAFTSDSPAIKPIVMIEKDLML
jgi:hypothetical protein